MKTQEIINEIRAYTLNSTIYILAYGSKGGRYTWETYSDYRLAGELLNALLYPANAEDVAAEYNMDDDAEEFAKTLKYLEEDTDLAPFLWQQGPAPHSLNSSPYTDHTRDCVLAEFFAQQSPEALLDFVDAHELDLPEVVENLSYGTTSLLYGHETFETFTRYLCDKFQFDDDVDTLEQKADKITTLAESLPEIDGVYTRFYINPQTEDDDLEEGSAINHDYIELAVTLRTLTDKSSNLADFLAWYLCPAGYQITDTENDGIYRSFRLELK